MNIGIFFVFFVSSLRDIGGFDLASIPFLDGFSSSSLWNRSVLRPLAMEIMVVYIRINM